MPALKFVSTFTGVTLLRVLPRLRIIIRYHAHFYEQLICEGSNVKNGLKVKQLAKQPPTLNVLMQKNLVGPWLKNVIFSILNSLKLSFCTTVNGTTYI